MIHQLTLFLVQTLQNASTKPLPRHTWETTSEESTHHRQYQANGCALSGLAKKLQGLFWTITSMRNINKTTQTLNVQNVENHLLQRETWKGTWVSKSKSKSKHKAVEASNISRNSNESISDDNYNPDIIINAVFIWDYLWLTSMRICWDSLIYVFSTLYMTW